MFTVTTPNAPVAATIREEANVTCSNDKGKILVDPTGGKGPYTINLENTTSTPIQVNNETNLSSFIFEGLSAGDFHVTVTDAFGCVFSDTIELIRPDDIVPTITQTPLTCFDGNNASIMTSVVPRTNPTAPVYEYRLLSYGDNASNVPQIL